MKKTLVFLGIFVFSMQISSAQNVFPETGRVGIGTSRPDEMLSVKGKIHAEEIKIDLSVPADYVFQKYYTGTSTINPNYKIISLDDVESFTKENHHLPNVPSAKDIKEKGLYLAEMSNILLQKVEELTIYIIEQSKIIKNQTERIKILEEK